MIPRRLIINADDFGLSAGVNRGIIDAHVHGILTSASLMVRFPAAEEAAALAQRHPRLSIGLHLDLGEWIYRDQEWVPLYTVVDPTNARAVREELASQLARFHELMHRRPTHLDSHQHTHLDEPVLSLARESTQQLGIPLRGCSWIQYCGGLYGQTDEGAPNHSALTLTGFRDLLAELGPGDHELSCHPGYATDLETMYREERKMEVTLLCDPSAKEAVVQAGFQLCSFRDF